MVKLIFLGTSNAISSEDHENTYMAVVGEKRMVLIDCPHSPFLRFQKAGLDFKALSDLILTHFHPDHVSGVPLLLMNMWLMGRLQPLNIYGLQYTIDRIENLMGSYNWSTWPGFFPVRYHRLPEQALVSVLECDEFHIFASPMQHFIPSIGLRIEFTRSKKVLAYSCDTEPCTQEIKLAEGADVFVHEASGALPGHSSASQAGEAARLAEAGSLYLIHYPTGRFASGDPVIEARQKFDGPVTLAEDYMELNFS
ncbi:MAG: MBL fold metallo-hydrolase [Anaerolineales bacterium]|jgi:ribonuclease Z